MNEKKSLILMVEDEEQVLMTDFGDCLRSADFVATALQHPESVISLKNSCRIFSFWTLCFRTETAWISAAASAKKP